MPQSRKNGCKGARRVLGRKGMEALWFIANVTRQRRRNRLARIARRKTRDAR